MKNVIMPQQQWKTRMPEIIAASDVNLVLLKKADLFKTLIPSKIFEAMAMERPIILGVEGESKEIIEEGDYGICIEPENARELSKALVTLYGDKQTADRLGRNGRRFVERYFILDKLADEYLDLLRGMAC